MSIRFAAIACVLLLGLSPQKARPTVEVFEPGVRSDGEVYRGTFTLDGGSEAQVSLSDGPQVRYVANSGMLVSLSGRRFLIDAPIREGLPPYATSSAAERALLEGAREPYDRVDAMLITHWHEDHFSPEAIAAHLISNPRSLVVSSPEVIERVRAVAPRIPASQLRAVLPAPGDAERIDVGGVPIHVLRIRHNPARRLPEQHVGFLIGDAAPVLHVGDADPAADNFSLLKSLPPVDLALLPFWYLSDSTNLQFVADSIRPRRMVAMHIPPNDVAHVSRALKEAKVSAAIAAVPGSALTVPHGRAPLADPAATPRASRGWLPHP